jgi:hypothetical protein
MITAAQYAGTYEQIGTDTYRVKIQLTDDVTGVSVQWFVASGATTLEIRDNVSRQIASINAAKSMKTTLDGIANGTNIPVTAPAAPAATAQQQYFSDVARLVHMKQLVDAGGMLASNTEYVALQTSVKNAYLASYATSF